MRAHVIFGILFVFLALFALALAADSAESPVPDGQNLTFLDISTDGLGHGLEGGVVLATSLPVDHVCGNCGLPVSVLPDGTEVASTLPCLRHESAGPMNESGDVSGCRAGSLRAEEEHPRRGDSEPSRSVPKDGRPAAGELPWRGASRLAAATSRP